MLAPRPAWWFFRVGVVGCFVCIPPLARADSTDAKDTSRLAEVVVTATRTEAPADESTTSVSVIHAEQIQQQDDRLVSESLFGSPGMDVTQFGSLGQSSFASIRGSAPDQVLVLLDGVEVNSPTVGQFDFADLTPDNVDRIEIVRGAGGTLHGSGAIGGVVNVLSRRGDGPFRFNVSAEGGSAATQRETLELVGASGPFSLSGSGTYLDSDGFRSINDDYRNISTAWRADLDVLPDATARVFARYNSARSGLVNFNVADGVLDPDARRRSDFLLLKGEWEHALSANLNYRAAVSYVHDNLRVHDDAPDADDPDEVEPRVTERTPSEIVAAEGQLNYSFGSFSLSTIGLEVKERSTHIFKDVQREEIDEEGEVEENSEVEDFRANRTNVAVYGQEQLQFFDGALRGVGGVRYDHYDQFGGEVTWTGSAGYLVRATDTRFRVGYAEGFRAPTFDELFDLQGNPDLEAEESWEINAGLTQDFFGGRLRLEPTYFYRSVHNLIEEVADQLPGPIAPIEDDDMMGNELTRNLNARFQGLEMISRARLLPWLSLNGNYTYLNAVTPSGELLNRPRHRGSVAATASHGDVFAAGDRVAASLAVHVVGHHDSANPRDDFEAENLGSYARTDLNLSYGLPGNWSNWAVTASVRNLFNRDYSESIGFPAPGANFLIGFRYRG
ncbi:MAG TPA: TonB-dependent receptor [Candidatus Acidoferrales bacterium]|nr:TonB-dependent receptor [Candidatus Acidoferrales bacterium]